MGLKFGYAKYPCFYGMFDSSESARVTDYHDNVSDNEDFKLSIDSFNDFCRELNLSKFLSIKCFMMLKKTVT